MFKVKLEFGLDVKLNSSWALMFNIKLELSLDVNVKLKLSLDILH